MKKFLSLLLTLCLLLGILPSQALAYVGAGIGRSCRSP